MDLVLINGACVSGNEKFLCKDCVWANFKKNVRILQPFEKKNRLF